MKDIHEKVQAAMQDNEKNAHGTAQQAIPKSPKSLWFQPRGWGQNVSNDVGRSLQNNSGEACEIVFWYRISLLTTKKAPAMSQFPDIIC